MHLSYVSIPAQDMQLSYVQIPAWDMKLSHVHSVKTKIINISGIMNSDPYTLLVYMKRDITIQPTRKIEQHDLLIII